MKRFAFGLILSVLAAPAAAQQMQNAAQIPFSSVPDFLRTSPDRNFGEVLGVAVNSSGEITVLNHPGSANFGPIWANATTEILHYDADGRFLREIGRGVYGLAYAHQIRYDENDNLWVIDKGANSVIQFDPEGYVVMNLGRREEGYHGMIEYPYPPSRAEARSAGGYLGGPTDVAWDPAGNIYISDGYVNSRVAKFDVDGNFLAEFGSYGNGEGQLNLPHAMVADRQGNLYVADRSNFRIQVWDSDGNFLRTLLLNQQYPADYQPPFAARNPGRQTRPSTAPWAMCITNTSPQYMWVADNEPGRIYKMTLDGEILGWLGSSGRRLGQFNWIHGLDCSQPGILYVADMNNWRVQKLILQEDPTN